MATTINPDAIFLTRLGRSLMLSGVNLIVSALFYSVYAVLFCVAVTILCRRSGNAKARFGLLFAVVAMFTLSSFWMWSNTDLFMLTIRSDFLNDVGKPLAPKHAAFAIKYQKLASVAQVLIPLEIIIGDTIVFWRAWSLCDVNRRIVIVPFVFLLATIACSFGFLGCYVQHDWPIQPPPVCNNLEISAFSLSVVTNITGTLAIGYRFWLYRQAVGKYLGKCRYKTRIEKILVVLLETGAIYSILWIVELVLAVIPAPSSFAGSVVQQIFIAALIQLVGIYPTLVIVLVYKEYSLWDSSEVSTTTTSGFPTASFTSSPPTPEDFNLKSNTTLVAKSFV